MDRVLIIQRFGFLLYNTPTQKQKELYTFYKRMLLQREQIFTVPFIEYVSEGAIRNIKMKQKISGQFKEVVQKRTLP